MTLKEDFQKQAGWTNFRSSAIFALHLRPGADLRLLFLNYWRLKNQIAAVRCNIRVYSEDGTLSGFDSFMVEALHNDVSIARLLNAGSFTGSVEIEFLSTENLRFPFPAVTAAYVYPEAVSAVHSSGRLKNTNEVARPGRQLETNWSCTLDSEFEPYFHLFNGNVAKPSGQTVTLTAHAAADCRVLLSREIATGVSQPFASCFFHLSECFDAVDLERLRGVDFFLSAEVESGDVFPRLIVGNRNRKTDYYTATHTYSWVKDPKDVVPARDGEVVSYMPMITTPALSLDAVAFPTTLKANVVLEHASGALGSSLPAAWQGESWRTGERMRGFGQNGGRFGVWRIRGSAPARVNTSYRFSVAGAPRSAGLMTDIATGFKPSQFPPKHSHWGHGLVGAGFETDVLLANVDWAEGGTMPLSGTLSVFTKDRQEDLRVSVGADAAIAIPLSTVIGDLNETQSVSWYLKCDRPNGTAFWLSHHADGRICGDHAF